MEPRRFITAFTSARQLFLYWAKLIQSVHPSHFLKIHLSIFLPSTLWSSKWSLFLKILHQNTLFYTIRATCPAHLILIDFITRAILGEENRSLSPSLCSFLHLHFTPSLLGPNILLNTLSSKIFGLVPPSVRETRFHTQAQQKQKL